MPGDKPVFVTNYRKTAGEDVNDLASAAHRFALQSASHGANLPPLPSLTVTAAGAPPKASATPG